MKRLINPSLKLFKIITIQINKKFSNNKLKIKIINNKNLRFLNQHNSLERSFNNLLNSLNKNNLNKNNLNKYMFKNHSNNNHNNHYSNNNNNHYKIVVLVNNHSLSLFNKLKLILINNHNIYSMDLMFKNLILIGI